MEESGRRVFIIEHDPDLAELIETALSGGGYRVEWALESPGLMEEVHRLCPDLLIVDIAPFVKEHTYELLDKLRADQETRAIPILAVTTLEPLAEEAAASYNVKATLVKPFELFQLIEKTREALSVLPIVSPSPPTHRADFLASVEAILAEHSREAIFRWVRRLQEEPPWRGRSDLHLSNYLDQVPVLVEVVVAALPHRDPDAFFSKNPEALRPAREHALVRRNQGITLETVIREYTLLRDEIWDTIRQHLPGGASVDDVLALAQRISRTLDRIVEATISAYLEEQERASA